MLASLEREILATDGIQILGRKMVKGGGLVLEPELSRGFKLQPYVNQVSDREMQDNPDEDACITFVEPEGYTPVFTIDDPKSVFTETVIAGEGCLLVFQPEVGLWTTEVDATNPERNSQFRTLVLPPKSSFAWIAGKRGLITLGTNLPGFFNGQEHSSHFLDHSVPRPLSEAIRNHVVTHLARPF